MNANISKSMNWANSLLLTDPNILSQFFCGQTGRMFFTFRETATLVTVAISVEEGQMEISFGKGSENSFKTSDIDEVLDLLCKKFPLSWRARQQRRENRAADEKKVRLPL